MSRKQPRLRITGETFTFEFPIKFKNILFSLAATSRSNVCQVQIIIYSFPLSATSKSNVYQVEALFFSLLAAFDVGGAMINKFNHCFHIFLSLGASSRSNVLLNDSVHFNSHHAQMRTSCSCSIHPGLYLGKHLCKVTTVNFPIILSIFCMFPHLVKKIENKKYVQTYLSIHLFFLEE